MTDKKFEKCSMCGKKPENPNVPVCKKCFNEANEKSMQQIIELAHEAMKKRAYNSGASSERQRIAKGFNITKVLLKFKHDVSSDIIQIFRKQKFDVPLIKQVEDAIKEEIEGKK